MNKIFLFLVLIIGFSSVNAQWGDDLADINAYLSIGYGYMSPSSKGLDDFTSNYNNQRKSILSKEMESVGMWGMAYNTGIVMRGLLLEFGYTGRNGKMSSEADPVKVTPGSLTKREIDLKLGSYNFTFGVLMGENMLYLGPIFELSINSIDFETVNRNGKSYNVEMDTWMGGNVGAMLIFGNIARSGGFLTIKPYYSFGISTPDWRKLYEATSTNQPDSDLDATKGGLGGFNINATFSLNIACF